MIGSRIENFSFERQMLPYALLEVSVNDGFQNKIAIPKPRDQATDCVSLVLKIAEHFGYPNLEWLMNALNAFHTRATGKPLNLQSSRDNLGWLLTNNSTWQSLHYSIQDYDDAWSLDLRRWYASAYLDVLKWHCLETNNMRSSCLNFTVRNIGNRPASGVEIEARIRGNNMQKLYQSDNFSYRGDDIGLLGNNVEYDNDWYFDLHRMSCALSEKPVQKNKIVEQTNGRFNINKPVWYKKTARLGRHFGSGGKFNSSLNFLRGNTEVTFKCGILDDIVHFEKADCPGFYVNFFYQKIDQLIIDYRAHSRDQEKPTVGTLVIPIEQVEQGVGGSDPWLKPEKFLFLRR